MEIKVLLTDKGSPPGKVADAELHFTEGPLAGLKLVGFVVWETRGRRSVTLPARQYSVNGERRSFALVRPILDGVTTAALSTAILEAYALCEERWDIPADRAAAGL